MCEFIIKIVNSDLIKIMIPVFVVILGYLMNERSKRRWEEYQRKEDSYKILLTSLKGFYEESKNDELKQEFIDQSYLAWLYLPDSIIHKIYSFIDTVHTDGTKYTDDNRTETFNELIASLRKDLISRKRLKTTKLSASDFKHLTVTKKAK